MNPKPGVFAIIAIGLACMGISHTQRTFAESRANREKIRVAAASDLRFALEKVVADFQAAHPDIRVELIFGSSGNLYAQISNGAPFDVFLSADVEFPRRLLEAGKAEPESEFKYAIGHLVLWTPKTSPLRVDRDGLDALGAPGVRKIALANPRHAPYGRAAEAALKKLPIYDEVRPKLVMGDSVMQAAQFAESGAADAAIIAKSLAVAPAMAEKGMFYELPVDAYPPLEQGGVILKRSEHKDAAREFCEWLTGPKGRDVLKRFGFGLPGA